MSAFKFGWVLSLAIVTAATLPAGAQPEADRPVPPPTDLPDEPAPRSFWEWDRATDDLFGVHSLLEDHGIRLDVLLLIDWTRNFAGGIGTDGTAFRHLFTAGLTVETEKLIGFPGGKFFTSFVQQNGEDGSSEVGDWQTVGNYDADGRTQLAELWYEQSLWDGLVRVKAGKIDANFEFAYVEHGGEFVNGSAATVPTSTVMPTYPDPAMGLTVFVEPAEWLYFGVGIFDGAVQEGVPTGLRGPKTLFDDPADLYAIGEAGLRWELGKTKLAGRLALGGWGHTGTFDRFDGGAAERGTSGFYLMLDQMLWRENPDDEEDGQGLGAFFQYDVADADVMEVDHHLAAGVAWTGLIPSRDNDVIGLGASWVHFTDEPGAGFLDDSETNIEAFYKFYVTPFFSLKPDLQYIVNPGGADLDDAVVGTLRIEIVF